MVLMFQSIRDLAQHRTEATSTVKVAVHIVYAWITNRELTFRSCPCIFALRNIPTVHNAAVC
jgi:hypothetical protein